MSSTVELPADEDIKQLAHDVVRKSDEGVVPIVLDFYEFISQFDEERYITKSALDFDQNRSEVTPAQWWDMTRFLENKDVLEKNPDTHVGYRLKTE